MSALDLSADIGLVAIALAMLNMGIGLLMWGPYSPWGPWPHPRFDVFRLHRLISYGTLDLPRLHVIPLLFLRRPLFAPRLPFWERRAHAQMPRQLSMGHLGYETGNWSVTRVPCPTWLVISAFPP